MSHPPLLDPPLWAVLTLFSHIAVFYLGRWIERHKRKQQPPGFYAIAERAKVVWFSEEQFHQLAKCYRASSEQRSEVVESLMNPPPLDR
jgi:hypothetical protein